MSLYNLLHGYNPAVFYVLPMLGKPVYDYPRFRDCFAGKPYRSTTETDIFGMPKMSVDQTHPYIAVYTRVGGVNREDYIPEITALRAHPQYVEDYDDGFDHTFATFIFAVPPKWEPDYHLLLRGAVIETSPEYKALIEAAYPDNVGKMPWNEDV